jgi:CBS domain-containing protein
MLSGCWHGFCSRGRQHCAVAAHLQTRHRGGEGMQVREIMSKDIEVVDRNDNLRSVEERMATKQLRHLPVLEQGEVVGIVTQRDLFKAAMSSTMGYGEKAQQAYLQSVRVKEIMTYPVVTISPDISVAAAAEMMINKGIGCLPVVDAQQLIGIVTKTDLLRCLHALDAA